MTNKELIMDFIKRMLDRVVDYTIERPGTTLIIFIVILILFIVIAPLLGVDMSASGSFPLIIFM